MRAVTQKAFGGPEVLQVVEIDPPVPMPSEVLVRVKAIGLNPVEATIRSGAYPLLGQPPFILGWDISGVVEAVVPGVTRFKPGDEVFGMPFFPRAAKGYAEYAAMPSRQMARKPASISHTQAASLPMAGLAAWQCLVDIAEIQEGDRVLIHGAGGGVGHLAIQIAKAWGAYVIASVSPAKAAFVASLGADELIDYQGVDFTQAVKDVDVVLETIGGNYADRSLQVLRPDGLLITIVDRSNRDLAERTETAGMRFAGFSVEPDHLGLEHLAGLVNNRLLRPHVEHALPLEEVAQAHRLLEASPKGKVVLTT